MSNLLIFVNNLKSIVQWCCINLMDTVVIIWNITSKIYANKIVVDIKIYKILLYFTEGTFTTIITAWPHITDLSLHAQILRVIIYLMWWFLLMRSTGLQILLITILIAINHQYKNLQSYFYSLNGIFEDKNLDHIKKEELYEKSVKVGIRLHAETLW